MGGLRFHRDPLDSHMRCWLAHWVQPSPDVPVRAAGNVAFPAGCGLAALPRHIGELDSQALIPENAPAIMPTVESYARERDWCVRHGVSRAHLPRAT